MSCMIRPSIIVWFPQGIAALTATARRGGGGWGGMNTFSHRKPPILVASSLVIAFLSFVVISNMLKSVAWTDF